MDPTSMGLQEHLRTMGSCSLAWQIRPLRAPGTEKCTTKPIIQNQRNAVTPIFQSELFFPFDENVGLIDGDVVSLDGTTAKFLCKSLDSPDSLNRLNYAIKYTA